MIKVHKKVVTDETGKPTEVILPIEEYREIEEILGLDLSEADQQSIKAAQESRRKGRLTDFHPLGN
jgi:hypothetical protein